MLRVGRRLGEHVVQFMSHYTAQRQSQGSLPVLLAWTQPHAGKPRADLVALDLRVRHHLAVIHQRGSPASGFRLRCRMPYQSAGRRPPRTIL